MFLSCKKKKKKKRRRSINKREWCLSVVGACEKRFHTASLSDGRRSRDVVSKGSTLLHSVMDEGVEML